MNLGIFPPNFICLNFICLFSELPMEVKVFNKDQNINKEYADIISQKKNLETP